MKHSTLKYSIILTSSINIFVKVAVAELDSRNKINVLLPAHPLTPGVHHFNNQSFQFENLLKNQKRKKQKKRSKKEKKKQREELYLPAKKSDK